MKIHTKPHPLCYRSPFHNNFGIENPLWYLRHFHDVFHLPEEDPISIFSSRKYLQYTKLQNSRNCDVISVSLDTLVFISSYSTCLMIPVTKRKHFPSPDCKMILFCWLRWHTGMHKTQNCVSGPHFWMNHPKPYVKSTCFIVFCLGLLPVNLIHYLPNYLTATGAIIRMHSVRVIVKQPWCITVAS